MEMINLVVRKARKDHTCDTCESKIYKGEEYDYQTNIYGGEIYNWKQCHYCKSITDRMFKEGYYPDGITDQDFWDYVADHDIAFKKR